MSSPRRSRSPSPRRSASPPPAKSDHGDRDSDVSNHGNNLYVSGLNSRTVEDDLQRKFAKCGKVIECSVVRDRDNNPRGFGFVRMETSEQADAAVSELNGHELNGYPMRVEKAKRSCPRDPTPGRYLGNDRSRRNMRSYGDRYGGDRYGGDRYGDRYGSDRYGGDRYSSDRYGGDRYGGDRGGDRYDDRYRGYGGSSSSSSSYDREPRSSDYSRSSSRYQPYERRSPPSYRRSRSRSR